MGGAIAFGGFAVGIGMVTFAEAQGERGKERGAGLSDNMSTQLTGMLMEDVEVSSVEDLGSLTNQLGQIPTWQHVDPLATISTHWPFCMPARLTVQSEVRQ